MDGLEEKIKDPTQNYLLIILFATHQQLCFKKYLTKDYKIFIVKGTNKSMILWPHCSLDAGWSGGSSTCLKTIDKSLF